jgi:hypothetical protein
VLLLGSVGKELSASAARLDRRGPSTARLRRSPDFLWRLVALANLRHLSRRKGAHVDLSGAS